MNETDVEVHPLAVTCICDHYTRVQVGGSLLPPGSIVVGMLFGQRSGEVMTIVDATDAVYGCDARGNAVINTTELSKKITLWTTMGEDRGTEFLGWYSFGSTATAEHVALHNTMAEFGTDLLFLLMDPNPNPLSSHPSFSIYKKSSRPEMAFVVAPYKLETVEAERIAVDQVVKSSISQTESAEKGLMGLSRRQSVLALQKRIEYIISVLGAIGRGEVEADHSFLRSVAKLCCDLPYSVPADNDLDEGVTNSIINTLSVAVLASASRTSEHISDLNTKFVHVFAADRHGMR